MSRSQAQQDAVRRAAAVSARNRAEAAKARRARAERHAEADRIGAPRRHYWQACGCGACTAAREREGLS